MDSRREDVTTQSPIAGKQTNGFEIRFKPKRRVTLSNLTLSRAVIVTKFLETGDREIEKSEANAWILTEILAHELKSRARSGYYGEEFSEPEEMNGNI